jgi:hypothetical protein
MRSLLFVFLCSLLLFAVAGCGSKAVPVSGKVTLDGQPLANAVIAFVGDRDTHGLGAGAEGKTDANGNYTLRILEKNLDGALPGKYKVVISVVETENSESNAKPAERKEKVPEMYNSRTELKFEVPSGGTSTANFDLTTPKDMPGSKKGGGIAVMPGVPKK